MRSRPDILVLGSGGVRGEAWISGVLAGIEDAGGFELDRCEYFLGTSAGAIVAARLAAGLELERPAGDPPRARDGEPATPGAPPHPRRPPQPIALAEQLLAWAAAIGSPLITLGLSVSRPGGALARSAILRGMPLAGAAAEQIATGVEATGVRFDGRLRVTAVARRSGHRVVFGQPGAPPADVGRAVAASCAVPWLFRPVSIGAVEYVDGGVWSPTNLDAAPARRGSQVLCLSPTAGLQRSHPATRALGSLSRAVTELEASVLRGRGAAVTVVVPDALCAEALGTDLMERAGRDTVLVAGYRQGLAVGASPKERGGPPRRRGPQATTPDAGVTRA